MGFCFRCRLRDPNPKNIYIIFSLVKLHLTTAQTYNYFLKHNQNFTKFTP